ncbi:c-type cytochrome [Chitinophaga sp.]|uniref:c-type cytochrome n=1 Tax=Chitinophaga sp. TaxID=1869181 RepID=UPI002F94CAFD
MKYYCILCLLLVASCTTPKEDTWQTLDFGAFQLKAPPDWKIMEFEGVDSYGGGLTNNVDSLTFDYGEYDVDFETGANRRVAEDTVNGVPATIMIPVGDTPGIVSMHLRPRHDKNQFTIWGHHVQQQELILKIYKTIVFKHSDTTVNPPLTADRFIISTYITGKTLFQMNCAGCHAPLKELTGPPLATVFKSRDQQWVCQFLRNRNSILKDSLQVAYEKEYQVQCTRFPDLSCAEIRRIMDYAH